METTLERRGRRVGAAAAGLALLLAMTSLAEGALAAAPPLLFRVPSGEVGSGAGQFDNPRGIGVDANTGHIYVGGGNNMRIDELSAQGEFIKSWGWGVADGTSEELQTCTTACFKGRSGSAGGQFNFPQGVAVDSQGNVYVAETENHRVQKFDGEGNFLLMFGGDVIVDGAAGTGIVSPGSASITSVVTTEKVFGVGQRIEGTGIEPGTTIAAVGAGTITLSQVAGPSATGTTTNLTVAPGPNDVPTNEKQTVKLGANTTGGTFSLTYTTPNPSPTSATATAIPVGATALELEEKLEGLSNIGSGNVAVTGVSGGPWTVEFEGTRFANTDVTQMSANASGLTVSSGSKEAVVTSANVGEICSVAAECRAGAVGTANGQFATGSFGNYIAVGPGDTVFVGDKERIQEFDPDGKFKGEVKVAGTVEQLALDSAGDFYVVSSGNLVRKLGPSGEEVEPKTFPVNGPGPVTVDAGGNLYAVENPPGFGTPAQDVRIVEYDPAAGKLIPTEEEEEKGEFFAQLPGNSNLRGLATHTCPATGDTVLYVTDSTHHLRAFGPALCDPKPPAPEIEAQYAASVGVNDAVLKAEINPNFSSSTTYYLRYGLSDCEVGPCTEVPAPPGLPLGTGGGTAVTTAGITLDGLSPGTTYHYLFVAISVNGDEEFVVEGKDSTFTTHRGGLLNLQLPDNRGFEMVSPPQKNSAEPGRGGGTTNALLQASHDGEAVSYVSNTAFGEAQSAPVSSQYLSSRGPGGWSTANITPRDQGGVLKNAVFGFSPDLSLAALVVREPPLCCGATPGVENLYLQDNASGALTLLTDAEPRLTIPKGNYCVAYGGASADFERVIFAALGALTPDAPEGNGFNLYEWSTTEGLALVSVLPNGEPAVPAASTGFGAGMGAFCMGVILHNAISEDGSRIFWTLGGGGGLFARLDGSKTVQLDALQGGPGPAGGGRFWAASADGSKVFFTAVNKLTPDAKTGDLYRYDFDAPEGGRLSDLTAAPEAANVRGVVGAAEAGDNVYFVATGVLAENEGAAEDLQSGLPQKAKAGQNNLYLWQEGEGIRFIARLAVGEVDEPNWSGSGYQFRTARVSPDGRHLAFLSIESLTGYDNIGQGSGKAVKEAYLYDAEADELTCASCNPTGARPLGPAALTAWKLPYEQPRFLSDGGGRLFFESFDSLDPRDVNGVRDVYEFEREGVGDCDNESPAFGNAIGACVSLISSGGSDKDSYFIDASASGDDLFVSTYQQLVGADEDEYYDIYDARVNGGFPDPPPPLPICDGRESCAEEGTRAPASSPPATPSFAGPADPIPTRCRKGQAKRRGKCVQKPKCRKGQVKRKGRCVKRAGTARQRKQGRHKHRAVHEVRVGR
ncbi:MAG TPA: hypothetical protein VNT92_05715 [Acidimicrobiia bacterium]|nr:hypothetical protein [Acidimicrobiia bacterium]